MIKSTFELSKEQDENNILSIPDSYDSDGKLTINSWQLFKDDELMSERYHDEE